MTSTERMHAGVWGRGLSRALALAALGTAVALGPGCAPKRELIPPQMLVAPYQSSGVAQGEVLWAVVPLRNESGTTSARPDEVSDAVVRAVEEAQGVRALPLNRTIAAMRALELGSVETPEDAQRLAKALGVDGVLVGTITSYDPYQPAIGMALALYGRPGSMVRQKPPEAPDSRELAMAMTEQTPANTNFSTAPLSVVSEQLSGTNHQVLLDVQRYAAGRHDPKSALNWRRYVASMPLYTDFAAFHMVERLMQAETLRLVRVSPTPGEAK